MRFAHRAALLVACTLASASALRAADVSEGIEPGTIAPPNVRPVRVGGPRQAELDAGPAWRAFRARYGAWRALWNEVTGTPHRALGLSIPLAGVADDAAAMDRAVRAFVEGNRGIFGTPTLETVAAERAGRVWYVRYRQTLGGVPVLFADWEFRVGENGRLMMFGADAHSPRGMVSTTPTLVRGVAREAATRGLRYRAGIDRVDDGGMWLVPYTTAAGLDYRLAYEERVHVQDPPGNWWTLVDARNGDVLWRQNRVRDDISGHVQGGIHPLLPTDPLSVQSFPNLDVFVGASTAVTNASGNYSAPASGTVAVKDSLFGLYCHVNNVEPPAGSFATTATNPATVNITWDLTNSADAERDAFYHVNVVHAFIKGVDPSFTGMDYAVPTTVNINATCNAYWDGTGINFYHAGNGCPNTATIQAVATAA